MVMSLTKERDTLFRLTWKEYNSDADLRFLFDHCTQKVKESSRYIYFLAKGDMLNKRNLESE